MRRGWRRSLLDAFFHWSPREFAQARATKLMPRARVRWWSVLALQRGGDMGETRRGERRSSGAASPLGGLYGRLLQRLAQALEEAESRARLYRRAPQELELRGLSGAELELIQAYREQDVQWLRGWHAAAEELALLEQADEASLSGGRRTPGGTMLKPLLRRQALRCALCGEPARRVRGSSVPPCAKCGSRLFRSGVRR